MEEGVGVMKMVLMEAHSLSEKVILECKVRVPEAEYPNFDFKNKFQDKRNLKKFGEEVGASIEVLELPSKILVIDVKITGLYPKALINMGQATESMKDACACSGV